jgi:hypothetical protein
VGYGGKRRDIKDTPTTPGVRQRPVFSHERGSTVLPRPLTDIRRQRRPIRAGRTLTLVPVAMVVAVAVVASAGCGGSSKPAYL